MGRVTVAATVENLADLFAVDAGTLASADVRRIELHEALVDTGASGFSLPAKVIADLGLKFLRMRKTQTAAGPHEARLFGTARLTIQGREFPTDVIEVPDSCPALIGQIPLEAMDWVIDMPSRKLIGNPAHGGEHVMEIYSFFE